MKARKFLMAFIVLIVTALVFSNFPVSAKETVTFRATINVPATQPPAKALKHWGDLVTERTDGRIKFEYLWGGSLTKAGEEIPTIQKGIANAGFFTAPYYPREMVLNSIFYAVPFGTPNPMKTLEIYYKITEADRQIIAELEQHNLKLICPIVFGSYEMLSVKPVKTLEDMKGLKAAVIGATLPKWFVAIGAVPISMPAPDRYTGLQTGLIGATVLPLGPMDAFNWEEVAKNLTYINLGAVVLGPIVMNADDFNKLSKGDQKIVLDAGKETGEWNAKQILADEERVKAKWKGLGVGFYNLSEMDKKAWAEKLRTVPYDWAKEWDAKGIAASKTLQAFFRAVKEVGYKYPIDWEK
jgi:TRAP-type C4-dicarboxylate transport system substrate-binding protein